VPEPNSIALVVLLFLAGAGAVVGALLLRPIVVKVICGLFALALAATGGIAIVNDYYGYYQTWSQLSADFSGSYTGLSSTPFALRKQDAIRPGQLREIRFVGAHSGITRTGIVYLPPQYFEPQYAHTRFPVAELLHGSPGSPLAWLVHLRLDADMNRMLAHHLVGPMIIVMPASNNGHHFQECLNAPGVLDDTYISQDVPADVRRMFRASRVSAEWGVAGYSSGGYCAANLAMRHPSSYGAAAIMDGYFRPADGQAAEVLHHDAAAEAANDPLLAARRLTSDSRPLPSFWIAAGSGIPQDLAAARAFTRALHGVEQVTLDVEPGAGHNFYAWQPALPRVLAWLWTQLAPPALRVQFPIAGPVRRSAFAAPGAHPGRAGLAEAGAFGHHRRHHVR
jgi:enterochelin esterase-like enzyme